MTSNNVLEDMLINDSDGLGVEPDTDADLDWHERYADLVYVPSDRRAHRREGAARRAPAARRTPVGRQAADQADDGDAAQVPTHACSDNEDALLRDSLGVFYLDNVITDVLARVKGGKEANVYCCRAHPSTGLDLIAAKIYRPRAHRTMRNDALYREGRLTLDEKGKGVVRDARIVRAMAKKTPFGMELLTFGWIEHEHDVMQALFADGADVPRPVGHVGSAILMEYFGELNRPAPTLDGVRLGSRGEAEDLFERLMWHVELMLRHNLVHGDLSAFNVLLSDGRPVVIDFPQAVVASTNRNAERLLQRDVERLCGYFARYGLEADAAALAADLWGRFVNARL